MGQRRVEPRWVLLEPDRALVEELVTGLGTTPVIGALLVNRGLKTTEAAREFLEPRLDRMPNPFLMQGMEPAVDRILAALDRGEPICVWGDYDVDGVTSASQLLAFFAEIGAPIRYFVPDRFRDGYGLNGDRLRELAAEGVRLVITVDCGISNAGEVDLASELGVDVVVVDHHQVPPLVPRAAAILNPHQPGCPWPEKGLAACGVAWVLCVALRMRLRERGHFAERAEPDLRRWLDLTAIGTVADMVPLTGLNRTIVQHGLGQIERSDRAGVRALVEVSHLAGLKMTAGRIGFHLGPRINAAGRLRHAGAGVELLTAGASEQARKIAREIDQVNDERREVQERIELEACELADRHPDPAGRRSIVLAQPGWHAGVLGIVCSKLIERYHRPTILLAVEDGQAKGSARSIHGFKLVEHLRQLEGFLDKYGGHDHAAGLTLRAERLEAFAAAFEALAREKLTPQALEPILKLDVELPVDGVGFDLVEQLQRLEPFGMGNPEPVFLARGVRVLDTRQVGGEGKHLKLVLEAAGTGLDAIAFGHGHRAVQPGQKLDLAYVPELNSYRGKNGLQLRIKGLRPSA
jgi:single-stranded-DNA-specific exonuclease